MPCVRQFSLEGKATPEKKMRFLYDLKIVGVSSNVVKATPIGLRCQKKIYLKFEFQFEPCVVVINNGCLVKKQRPNKIVALGLSPKMAGFSVSKKRVSLSYISVGPSSSQAGP